MKRHGWVLGVAAVAAVLAAVVVFLKSRLPVLQRSDRHGLPGRLARLSDGDTYYRLEGEGEGKPVVLVHGLGTPCFTWDDVAAGLIADGHRVLRYDLYGRGWSDRPRVRYDDDLYDRQLVELLDELGVSEPVHLVGLSMGGAIAVGFADRHPSRVATLTLLAPGGLPMRMPLPWATKLAKMPGVGELFLILFGQWILRSMLAKGFHDPRHVHSFRRRFEEQLRFDGYRQALLSTVRHMPILELAPRYRRVGRSTRPTLVVWGQYDRVVPSSLARTAARLMPLATVRVLPDVGHNLPVECPDAVLEQLRPFLDEARRAAVPAPTP